MWKRNSRELILVTVLPLCKGKITGAIAGKGLTSLDDVRAHTKASASCGSCTGLVEKLMVLTIGDKYNPAAIQPM